jgi:hypothetical protein
MTTKTRRRIYFGIYPVLEEIISSMREYPLRRIEMLQARFEFRFVRMTSGTKGRPMTGAAHRIRLRGIEPMVSDKTTTMIEDPNRF